MKEAKVSVRVYPVDAELSNINRLLGLDFKADVTLDGSELFVYSVEDDGDDPVFENLLRSVITKLETRVASVKCVMADGHMDLFLMYGTDSGQGSICLDKEIYSLLSNLGVNLIIDLYVSGTPIDCR